MRKEEKTIDTKSTTTETHLQIKSEKFSEPSDLSGNDMDENSRKSSDSVVLIVTASEKPFTINDNTDQMNRELQESIEKKLEKIDESDSMSIIDTKKQDPKIPLLEPGVKYKDVKIAENSTRRKKKTMNTSPISNHVQQNALVTLIELRNRIMLREMKGYHHQRYETMRTLHQTFLA